MNNINHFPNIYTLDDYFFCPKNNIINVTRRQNNRHKFDIYIREQYSDEVHLHPDNILNNLSSNTFTLPNNNELFNRLLSNPDVIRSIDVLLTSTNNNEIRLHN